MMIIYLLSRITAVVYVKFLVYCGHLLMFFPNCFQRTVSFTLPSFFFFNCVAFGTSLVVQRLRVRVPNGGVLCLIPGQWTRSHRPQIQIQIHRSHMPQMPRSGSVKCLKKLCCFWKVLVFIYSCLFIWLHWILAVAFRLLGVACGICFPEQGSNLCPLHWECRVLATKPPEKSLHCHSFACCYS